MCWPFTSAKGMAFLLRSRMLAEGDRETRELTAGSGSGDRGGAGTEPVSQGGHRVVLHDRPEPLWGDVLGGAPVDGQLGQRLADQVERHGEADEAAVALADRRADVGIGIVPLTRDLDECRGPGALVELARERGLGEGDVLVLADDNHRLVGRGPRSAARAPA